MLVTFRDVCCCGLMLFVIRVLVGVWDCGFWVL